MPCATPRAISISRPETYRADIPHHLLQNQKVRHQLPRLPSLPFQRRQEGIREPAGGSSEQGSLFLYVCCLSICLLKLPDISDSGPFPQSPPFPAGFMEPCPSGRSSARTFPSYGLFRYPAVAFSCQAGFTAFTTERAPPGHGRSGETKMFLCFFVLPFLRNVFVSDFSRTSVPSVPVPLRKACIFLSSRIPARFPGFVSTNLYHITGYSQICITIKKP